MFSALHEPCEFGVREALASSLDSKVRTVLWSSMVTMTACAIAPVAFFRGVILMLKDIRSPVRSAKHATDIEAEAASSNPLKIQTETPPDAGPVIA